MRDDLDLKKILTMPIEVIKVRTGKPSIEINSDDNIIKSTQQYKGKKDPDMSDIAIKFYEILYGFNEGEMFPYEMFAGDTMNSFDSIANFVPGAGKTKKERKKTNKEDWPEWLRDYEKEYHCLANFWVLPMTVGRGVGRLSKGQNNTAKSFNEGRRDYMDRFLRQYIKLNADYSRLYEDYTNKFPLPSFAKQHYLTGIYIEDGGYCSIMDYDSSIIKFSNIKEDENVNFVDLVAGVIEAMQKKIKARAVLISESDKADKLWNFMKEYIH